MDFIVKFTIGLFIFAILLLFFKATKKMSKNYLEEYNSLQVNHEEIFSRMDEQRLLKEKEASFEIPISHLDSLNMDEITWKINN